AQLKSRARQNVILELGFFLGKLGRARVCALLKPGVELPSDYLGMVFIDVDGGGAWQYKLAKEMKTAGLPVDLNRVPMS
ncbi:nucleotide-binding protein, partial [candidate division KSB1 bacterium]|nr:nucleotide-binding protein [candidate division KSB1 bacterium]